MNSDANGSFSPVSFRFGRDCREVCDKEEDNESSEDELDIILHGTPEQKRRLTRSLSRGSLQMSSSDDEFEKEMELELDAAMMRHERQFVAKVEQRLTSEGRSSGLQSGQSTSADAQAGRASAASATAHPSSSGQFYDDVYFDSDEEEESTKAASAKDAKKKRSEGEGDEDAGKHHPIPSNDELLYDPEIDDDNQNWMDKRRAQYYPKKVGGASPGPSRGQASGDENGAMVVDPSSALQAAEAAEDAAAATANDAEQKTKIPKTDAVLNCPACMTTLCIDCQRHDVYTNQYRAMFVMNCCILRGEQLRYPASKTKKRRWRRKRKHGEGEGGADGGGPSDGDELYNPVKCSICNTEVGVLDKSDIYHFFNVLSSAA